MTVRFDGFVLFKIKRELFSKPLQSTQSKKCHQEDTNMIIGSMVLLRFHSRTRDKRLGQRSKTIESTTRNTVSLGGLVILKIRLYHGYSKVRMQESNL